MHNISAQSVLAGMALVIIGVLTGILCFHAVPQQNQQLVTFALGAIAGALTGGAAVKLADRITNSSGSDATIQADPTSPPKAL